MKRIVPSIWLKRIIFFLLFTITLISISVFYNQYQIKNWKPTDDLIGIWAGKAVVKTSFEGEVPESGISIQLNISKDGSVTGKVGEAELIGAEVMRNRNQFEKWIGIKNDYIIQNGSLNGNIVKGDYTDKRNISIPFDISDGNISGSLFELGQWWEYPDPIFPRLKLPRLE